MEEYQNCKHSPSSFPERTSLIYFRYLRRKVDRQDENRRTLIWLRSFSPLDYRDLLSIEDGIDRLWYGGVPLNVIDRFLKEFIRLCERWESYRKLFLNPN
jgi:hypothetical protein